MKMMITSAPHLLTQPPNLPLSSSPHRCTTPSSPQSSRSGREGEPVGGSEELEGGGGKGGRRSTSVMAHCRDTHATWIKKTFCQFSKKKFQTWSHFPEESLTVPSYDPGEIGFNTIFICCCDGFGKPVSNLVEPFSSCTTRI